MIRPILLASVFALAAPAMAQEVIDDMAPPVTEGVAAPDAQDQTAPNLPPGHVPTGMDHSKMDHGTATQTDTGTIGTADTVTTATTAETTPATDAEAEADVAATATESPADTATPTSADAGMTTPTTTATSGTFTGMGGPADIQAEWATFDRIGDGMLTPLEFATWVADSMGRPMGADVDGQAVELLNETADELALVDTNNDWHVSRDELMASSPQ